MKFACSTCGEEHDGLPDVAFQAPLYFRQLPEEERDRRADLSSDFCTIDEEDFFIRACLHIPIVGTEETFTWGVWVSLSHDNFDRYRSLFERDPPEDEGPYFGWLSNQLPEYPDTTKLGTTVVLRPDNQRPGVHLNDADHPLVAHQRGGISMKDLIQIIGDYIHPN